MAGKSGIFPVRTRKSSDGFWLRSRSIVNANGEAMQDDALEHYLNDPNPYAVDPRLMDEKKAISHREEQLEFVYRMGIGPLFRYCLFLGIAAFIGTTIIMLVPDTEMLLGLSLFVACVAMISSFVLGLFFQYTLQIGHGEIVLRQTNRTLFRAGLDAVEIEPVTLPFVSLRRVFGADHYLRISQGRFVVFFPCAGKEEQVRIFNEINAFRKDAW